MKKCLWIMCGLPGSGKSTFIANNLLPLAGPVSAVISRDKIRFELLKDDDEYFSKEKEVWRKFISDIKLALNDDKLDNVIVDATHLNEASRTKLLRAIGEDTKKAYVNAICLKVNLDECLRRNSLRTGRALVPEFTIINMEKNFTIPTVEEGFDSVTIINNDSTDILMKVREEK